jgi:hypothetical protein
MSSPKLLFKPPCFELKDKKYKELVSMSLDDYFKWRQRKMWDFKAQFDGGISGVFHLDEEEWTTTASMKSETIRVRNNQRENYYPKSTCGKWVDGKSDTFNPAKEFGKIPDADLVKMRHNPCFDCSFTAFCEITIIWTNYIYSTKNYKFPPTSPPAPSCHWQQWNPTDYYFALANENNEITWFVNGKMSITAEFGLSFADDAKTDEDVKTVYFRPTLSGDYTQSESGACPVSIEGGKSTLKADYFNYPILPSHTNVQNNIIPSFSWSLKADRDL